MARDRERADEQDMPAGGQNDRNDEGMRGVGEDVRGKAGEEDDAFEDADDLEEDEDDDEGL